VPPATKPTPPAPPAAKKKKGGIFLVWSVLVHVVFILLAWFLVVQTVTHRKLTFTGNTTPPNPVHKEIEHKVQMAQKRESMSAPTQSKRVTTTATSSVSLPELPATPEEENTPLSAIAGMGISGRGAGEGFSGLGAARAAGLQSVPFFGVSNGVGLKGTFYDLKQTRDRKLTEIQPENAGRVPYHDVPYEEAVTKFVRGGFNPTALQRFYQAPVSLFAQQIFVPGITADAAPKAFGVEKEVQPSRWIAVYRGKVRAPETGTFHFVGWSDDVLVVRFNHNIVLDGSLARVSTWKRSRIYHYNFPLRGVAYEGFVESTPVTVNKGNTYDLEILIGESPGGHFFAQLLGEWQGREYKKDQAGNPILPIFRVANVGPPDVSKSLGSVPVAPDDAPWEAVQDSMLGSFAH
jgi:hypothetical protein